MHLSQYVHTHEVAPGIVGLYSPWGHEISFLPASYMRMLEQGEFRAIPPPVLDDLTSRRFVVEQGFESRILEEFQPEDEPISEMWMILVQSCNMACQYCVVEGNVKDPARREFSKVNGSDGAEGTERKAAGGHRRDFMGTDVADAAVRKFAAMVEKSRSPVARIVMYGGEPTLNLETLKHGIKAIREAEWPHLQRPPSILVITNGLAYQDELAEFFKQYRVSVSVSLDGLKRHHDSARVNLAGRPTFDRASESLRKYIAAGLNCGICTTIGTHNIDDLPEIVDYFADTFGVPVELEPPFDIPNRGGNNFYVTMRSAAPKVMEAYKRLRQRGIVEGLAIRRLAKLAQGQFHHRDCGAVGGQWVVAPDGMIGPCHSLVGERTYFSGDVRDEGCVPETQGQFAEWSKRMPINMPDCHGCSAIAICGGGCPYNALVKKGSIWKKDPQQCDFMEYILDWCLEDSWDRYRSYRTPAAETAFAEQMPMSL